MLCRARPWLAAGGGMGEGVREMRLALSACIEGAGAGKEGVSVLDRSRVARGCLQRRHGAGARPQRAQARHATAQPPPTWRHVDRQLHAPLPCVDVLPVWERQPGGPALSPWDRRQGALPRHTARNAASRSRLHSSAAGLLSAPPDAHPHRPSPAPPTCHCCAQSTRHSAPPSSASGSSPVPGLAGSLAFAAAAAGGRGGRGGRKGGRGARRQCGGMRLPG